MIYVIIYLFLQIGTALMNLLVFWLSLDDRCKLIISLFNALIVVVILQVLYSKIPLILSTVPLISTYIIHISYTHFVRKWYLIFLFEQNMILINLKNGISYDCSKSKTCLSFVFYSYILHVQSRTDSFDGYNISDDKKYGNNTETTFETNFKYRSIQINRIPDNEGERKIILSIITSNT